MMLAKDIKPSNFLVTKYDSQNENLYSRNQLGLADGNELPIMLGFYLAKLTERQSLSQQGEVLGTPLYMSPEQCAADGVNERTDVYSMGSSMYFALTGKPPFEGKSIIDTMQMKMSQEPDCENLPAQVKHIVSKAMARNKDERFQTMAELLAAIS